MRVTGIDIHASNSTDAINLSFRDPTNQGSYHATEIVGLDADEIMSKFYGTAGASDVRYYELSLTNREIVAKISLNPNYDMGESYASLREALYRFIASSRVGAIQLRFKDGDATVAAISGFVTKFEAPKFTNAPEVQLTITCTDRMLRALEEINVDISDFDPTGFSVADDLSTSPHGFRFGVIFSDTIIDFSVQDALIPTWAFEVNLTGSPLTEFVAGDELHFSSETDNRYLYMVRGFDIIPLLDRVIPTSIWPVLFPGENPFIFSESAALDYIVHYPTYWGV